MGLRGHSCQGRLNGPHPLAPHRLLVTKVHEDNSILGVDGVAADHPLNRGPVPLVIQGVLG